SFNSLLVTHANFGKRLPRDVVTATVIHELGHAFGAPHDPTEGPCFSDIGHFVMHSFTGYLNHKNHFEFSPCSLSAISETVLAKSSCFEEAIKEPKCGNFIREAKEECDSGAEKEACDVIDECCGLDCRINRTQGFHCSPQHSPCCSDSCHVATASSLCLPETECTFASYCDGNSSSCPRSTHKPNGTACHHGHGHCSNGACSVSVCHLYGLETCQCAGKRRNMCKLCCACPDGRPESCVPAIELDIRSSMGGPLFLDPGQHCDQFRGYCNEQREC
ncbi:hypothetical protein CAPTEDRAFT_25283, partial [Capitella teleta]